MQKAIHWFRRDLRLTDNTALWNARQAARQVVPVFCWDDAYLARPDVGAPRVWFLLESLKRLSGAIECSNGRLIVLRGDPAAKIPAFAARVNAEAVFWNRDYEPHARRRDEAAARALQIDGREARVSADLLLAEPEQVLTAEGRPYGVFTPFRNRWRGSAGSAPLPRIDDFGGAVEDRADGLPEIHGLLGRGLHPEFDASEWEPGEEAALARLGEFEDSALTKYADRRDTPAIAGTSRLSPYLKFGNISVRTIYEACRHSEKFVDELAWREFYWHVLWHWPEVESTAWQEGRRSLVWDDSPDLLERWKQGQTGYPMVDAGMRQLLREGWMHNRVRMIVSSFLTKDLHINWQEGERHFMLHLVDGDLAPNNGGWQWAAGTGVDPRPLRIFNPWLQSRKYDPDGEYIRRYVPELGSVPAEHIHQPHLMDRDAQQTYGCEIGRDYPEPCVDHDVERRVTMERYAQARERSQGTLF